MNYNVDILSASSLDKVFEYLNNANANANDLLSAWLWAKSRADSIKEEVFIKIIEHPICSDTILQQILSEDKSLKDKFTDEIAVFYANSADREKQQKSIDLLEHINNPSMDVGDCLLKLRQNEEFVTEEVFKAYCDKVLKKYGEKKDTTYWGFENHIEYIGRHQLDNSNFFEKIIDSINKDNILSYSVLNSILKAARLNESLFETVIRKINTYYFGRDKMNLLSTILGNETHTLQNMISIINSLDQSMISSFEDLKYDDKNLQDKFVEQLEQRKNKIKEIENMSEEDVINLIDGKLDELKDLFNVDTFSLLLTSYESAVKHDEDETIKLIEFNNIFLLVINSRNITERCISRLIDLINKYKSKYNDKYKSTSFMSKVITDKILSNYDASEDMIAKVIELLPIGDELERLLFHKNCTEDVKIKFFDFIYSYKIEITYKWLAEFCTNIINDNRLTQKVILRFIEKLDDDLLSFICIRLYGGDNSFRVQKFWNLILEKSKKFSFELSKVNNAINETKTKIERKKLNKSSVNQLLGELKKDVDLNKLLAIIEAKNTNEQVLEEIIKNQINFNKFAFNGVTKILNKIINSDKVTAPILVLILDKLFSINIPDFFLVKNVLKSEVMDDSVIKKIIELNLINVNDLELLSIILNNPKISEDSLILLFNQLNILKNELIEEVGSNFERSKKVFGANYFIETKEKLNFQLDSILSHSNMTFDALKKVYLKAASEKDVDTLLRVIENSLVSEFILNDILSYIDKFSSVDKEQILLAIRRKRENINNSSEANFSSVTIRDKVIENIMDGSTLLVGEKGSNLRLCKSIDPRLTYLSLRLGTTGDELSGFGEKPEWYDKLCSNYFLNGNRNKTILYIDNITGVKDDILALVSDIIEERHVPGHPEWNLPPNCIVVVSGDALQFKRNVNSTQLRDMVDYCVEVPFDTKEWILHALDTNSESTELNFHPKVLSFLASNGTNVMFSDYPEDVTKPRLSLERWKKISDAIYKKERRSGEKSYVSEERIKALIGDSDVANSFIEHYNNYLFDINKVEDGSYNANDFANETDKYYALSVLISKYDCVSEKAIEQFITTCLGTEYFDIYKKKISEKNNTNINLKL